jgi:hypothetical protein
LVRTLLDIHAEASSAGADKLSGTRGLDR